MTLNCHHNNIDTYNNTLTNMFVCTCFQFANKQVPMHAFMYIHIHLCHPLYQPSLCRAEGKYGVGGCRNRYLCCATHYYTYLVVLLALFGFPIVCMQEETVNGYYNIPCLPGQHSSSTSIASSLADIYLFNDVYAHIKSE